MHKHLKDRNRDLTSDPNIDFSTTSLSYERFRQLARNPHLAPEERIGFEINRRRGYEDAILQDILGKVHPLQACGRTVLDIGCGAGALTENLVSYCGHLQHNMFLVDSEEMLELAPKGAGIKSVAGMFPANLTAVRDAVGPAGADAIITYHAKDAATWLQSGR